jgi:hypothetical protein
MADQPFLQSPAHVGITRLPERGTCRVVEAAHRGTGTPAPDVPGYYRPVTISTIVWSKAIASDPMSAPRDQYPLRLAEHLRSQDKVTCWRVRLNAMLHAFCSTGQFVELANCNDGVNVYVMLPRNLIRVLSGPPVSTSDQHGHHGVIAQGTRCRWPRVFEQPPALFRRQPVPKPDARASHTLDMANACGQLGTQQTASAASYAIRRTAASRRLMVAGA